MCSFVAVGSNGPCAYFGALVDPCWDRYGSDRDIENLTGPESGREDRTARNPPTDDP